MKKYLITLSVESMLECNDIGMVQFFHNLELSIFVSLILVDFLDGDYFSCLCNIGLKMSKNGRKVT